MKIRKIRSNKEKKLKIMDIIFLLICILITGIKMRSNMEVGLIDWILLSIKMIKYDLEIAIYIGIIFAIICIFTNCFWLIIIYIPIRYSRKKVIKQNLKYKVIDNIEYYREFLENVSPAEISLVMDLELEDKKDISATILKLYNNKIIDFQDDKIILTQNNNYANLKNSEKEIINMLEDGKINTGEINNWKQVCLHEAMYEGYIQKRDRKNKKHFWTSTFVFIIAIICLIISIKNLKFYSENSSFKEQENAISELIESNGKSEKEQMQYLEKNPEIMEQYMILLVKRKAFIRYGFIAIICISIIMGVPFYKIFRKIVYASTENTNRYVRTRKGNILAEQIAGMQRYIHEFSLLSDKEKEQVKLWDDFLVYAVLLEENEKIIDDIFKYKNIKRFSFI